MGRHHGRPGTGCPFYFVCRGGRTSPDPAGSRTGRLFPSSGDAASFNPADGSNNSGMPILLVIFLVAACLPVAWPLPPFDWGTRSALTIMLVALLLPVAGHFALGQWATNALRRDPGSRNFVA